MKRACRLIAVLLLLAGCLPSDSLFASQPLGRETRVDSVLASVNGEPITLLDVILESGGAEMKLASMFTGERLYSETAKLRRSVIDNIIVRKLVYARYKANPFKIEKQYIEDTIDRMAAMMGDGSRTSLERKAAEMGVSMDDLRARAVEKIAVDAILSEFCDRQVYITPKDVYSGYEKNPAQWTIPAALEIQLLQILKEKGRSSLPPRETCARISALLPDMRRDPAVFTRAVAEYSDQPDVSSSAGTALQITASKLRPEFADALKNQPEGSVVGPVETPEAFYFLRVVKSTPARLVPFDDVAAKIKASLYSEAVTARRAEYAARLKAHAVIRYHF